MSTFFIGHGAENVKILHLPSRINAKQAAAPLEFQYGVETLSTGEIHD